MPIKSVQLKKFNMKELKAIIKQHKLGKVSKLKKAQLLALIFNADNSKDILSKLSPKIKKKRTPSAKQLAARQKFKEMVKAKKDAAKPKDTLETKGLSELKDMAMDKGLKLEPNATKEQVVNAVRFGKQNLKAMGGRASARDLTKKVKGKRVKAALKEVNDMMTDLIRVKVDEPIAHKKKLKKLGKKAFLDEIFGASKFNLKREIKDIVNEATDEQLEIFLSFNKKTKKEILEKRFNSSRSIGTLLKTFIK